MRNAFAKTIYELAKQDERICVLVADISPAGAMEDMRREFPDRFLNVGIAEQSMIGLAAGMAMRGLRPFCYTIATFALFRAYEFVRCDLAYQDLPVTVVGMGAGLAYPSLGGTHQAVEDVAVALACPGLRVLAPCDPPEVEACVRHCALREAGPPTYLRLGKAGEPRVHAVHAMDITKLRWARDAVNKADCTTLVVSYGPIAAEALKVAECLDADMVTVAALSPLDPELAQQVGLYQRAVVVEEASGAPLAAALRARVAGIGIESFALPRKFPHGFGTREELLAAAGLSAKAICARLA